MKILCGRPFIDLELGGPGGIETACTWVDTGGGAFILGEELAMSLGVQRAGGSHGDSGGDRYGKTETELRVQNLPVSPIAARTLIQPGRLHQPGYPATAFLPAHLMAGRDVLFDYPGEEFDVAPLGSMEPRGEELPAPRSPHMGFPRIELEIDGERLGFLLDTGASYTMVSDALIDRWLARHPEWPRTFGASRDASMGRSETDLQRIIRVPEMRWGSLLLSDVGVVARPTGTFESYMTKMMTAPIVGALAGNVLKGLRFQLSDDVVRVEQLEAVDAHDLDGVGLALAVDGDGSFYVVGVSEGASDSTRRQVTAGDRLVAVESVDVSGKLLHDVSQLLAGGPGETRRLVLARDSETVTVDVETAAIL